VAGQDEFVHCEVPLLVLDYGGEGDEGVEEGVEVYEGREGGDEGVGLV
jgi:hypothetical protein